MFVSFKSYLYQIFSAGSLYVHTPFTTTCPTEHKKQFVIETDPTGEDDPAAHAAHALAPAAIEYVPAGQFTHALALLAPVTPENAPAGHCTHAADEVAPTATE